MERMYRPKTLADLWEMPVKTVHYLIRTDQLRAVPLVARGEGKSPRYRVPESAANEYVKRSRVPPSAPAASPDEPPKRRRSLKGLAAELAAAPKRVRTA